MKLSCSKIEDFLFLGNKLTGINPSFLMRFRIKRVLTLRKSAIYEGLKVPGIEYLHIAIQDTVNDDILTHFPKCHAFIEEGQKCEQNVLVHCRKGRSRSGAVVISYLMAKYDIHWEEALQLVHSKRKKVRKSQMNTSFLYQLKLWDQMENTFNAFNPEFRLFLLKRWVYVMKKRIVSNIKDTDITILDKYFNILKLSEQAEGEPFRCRQCEQVLFREINVISELSHDSEARYQGQYILTEPREWMLPDVLHAVRGTIVCPVCKTCVGDYNWQRSLCSCIIYSNCKPYQVFRFVNTSLI